jgi:vitamin B12 transporter
LETAAFFSRFETRRANLDWVHDIRIDQQLHLVLGANLARESGANVDTFGGEAIYERSRRTRAAFAATQGRHGAFDHELAVRHDHDSVFGGETTMQAAAGWRFGAARAFASYGEGFRAPNFNQLYSPGFGGQFAGNPALGPERSDSWEIGLDGELGAWRLGARTYRSRIEDLIAFQGEGFRAINVRRADIEGVELAAGTTFGAWRFDLDLGWLDAVDRDSGLALLRRADYRHGLVLAYAPEGGIQARADLLRVGPRADFGAELDPYTLLGVGLDWPLRHGLRLGARVDNLLDEDYVLAAGFATAGREWRLTLDWEPQR